MSRLMKGVSYASVVAALLWITAGCASGPPKTEAQAEADKVMAERVEAALNSDRSLFAKHINVNADKGVVRLSGYVWEASDFEEAVYIASNVPGVTQVINDLELNRNGNENGPVAR